MCIMALICKNGVKVRVRVRVRVRDRIRVRVRVRVRVRIRVRGGERKARGSEEPGRSLLQGFREIDALL